MKRIVIDPADVRVVGDSRGPTRGPGAWLRRHRLRLAAMIAGVEAVALAFVLHGLSRLGLLAIAAGLIALHFWITPRIRSYFFRQLTWTLAFAQGLVAVLSVLLVVTSVLLAFVLFLVLLGLVLTGLAALLGQRR